MTGTQVTQIVPTSIRIGEVISLLLCFALPTLAVFARMYTKIRLLKDVRLEDCLSLLAWASFMGFIGFAAAIGSDEGGIVHIAYLSALETTLYTIFIAIVKLSILLQYITIFAPQRKGTFYSSVHVIIWINAVYYTVIIIVYVTMCPLSKDLWILTVPEHCLRSHPFAVPSGVLNVVSDFSILTLPLPLIWGLQMPRHKKIRVSAVFGFGVFACMASVVRLVYSIELLDKIDGTVTFQITEDKIALSSFAELAIGIIVGCLPVLPRFFQRISFKTHNLSKKAKAILNGGGGDKKYWVGESTASRLPHRVMKSSSHCVESDRESGNCAPQIATLSFPSASSPSRFSGLQVFRSVRDAETDRSGSGHGNPNEYREQSCWEDETTKRRSRDEEAIVENAHRAENMMNAASKAHTIQSASRVYIP